MNFERESNWQNGLIPEISFLFMREAFVASENHIIRTLLSNILYWLLIYVGRNDGYDNLIELK